ncbi:MAG: hypothetical protein A3C43_03025 [Candidatus Schekmanbacteria bacterium RIFCSPHIGHO2_02_FULL_38_11]|uniref:Uncharacterized protein n=1 Tax=Candidatus Schekmanbacteria bacterium RIFCSPLOWO2_12_FULL_38_15 TaxID=1817883 RepID=A0A1F7SFZ9_9BACT|nr:MAG: hypothetical protein A3H37_10280 [Candidatus Schekmanbacteria bacterium RIFCSPLOWO2_02_FULL_38_14]OGL52154.1 MAG: hypothetical protein A3G31_06970 [Candidatus Schekmanbacteria bacterium RIFCSPLOWO2_12_FULL_38_15]OGL53590.1 MAG: hypothetical protein A3C43_03025 [Candidatus Schekmanbacteria bacterium RIFCSPHIGHO2_02_FULL_38_11]
MPQTNTRVSFFKDKGIFLLIVLFFIISRLWVLDRGIFMWNDEELYNGTIAMEILQGLNLPLLDYQYTPHNGGTIVVGVLAAVFFKLFGNSYFSLKLVALLFSTLSLIFCLILLNLYFSRRTAIIAGLFFLFSPSTYTESTLIAWGAHAESISLSMFTILIFYEIFFSGKSYYLGNQKKSYLLFIAFGLSCGFSLYFAYITLYCLISCLFFWYLFDKMFFLKKYFLIFSVSFLAGFSPWLYYNWINSFKGMNIVKKYWGYPEAKNQVFEKAVKYFTYDLPALFDFHQAKIFGIAVLPYFYYFIFLTAFFFILYIERHSFIQLIKALPPSRKYRLIPESFSKELFFLAVPVIFSVMFFLSNVSIFSTLEDRYLTYRYFIPLYPFIFIIFSLFFSKFDIKESKNIPLILLLIILLFLGLFGSAKIPSYDRIPTYRNLDGYSYERLGWTTVTKFDLDYKKYFELGDKINPVFRHLYYHGIGWSVGGRGLVWVKKFKEFKNIYKLAEDVNPKHRSYYYQGIGYNVGFNSVYNQYEKCIKGIEKIDEKYKPYAYLGMSIVINENCREDTDIPRIVSAVDEKYRRFFYISLGEYYLKKMSLDSFELAIEKTDKKNQFYLYYEAGAFLFKYYSHYKTDDFEKTMKWFFVPANFRDAFYEGAGSAIGFYYRNRANSIRDEIDKLESKERISAYRGLGRYMAERYGFHFSEIFKFSNSLNKKYLQYFYEGVGARIAFRFGDNESDANSILKELDPLYKPLVEKGFKEELSSISGEAL